MATELKYELYESIVELIGFIVNDGPNHPRIDFYDGSKPWDGVPDGHNLLVSFEVSAGFYAGGRTILISDGNPITASPVASGVPTWFRLMNGYEGTAPPDAFVGMVLFGDVDGDSVGFNGPSGSYVEVGTDVTLRFAWFSFMEA